MNTAKTQRRHRKIKNDVNIPYVRNQDPVRTQSYIRDHDCVRTG